MKRIPPSERIREEVEQFFREGITGNSEESITGMLLRLGAQRLVQEALEQEVTDFLGRGYYEHHGQETAFRGHRNGYEPGKMPTAEGAIPVYIPQTRRTPEPFHSTLLPFLRQNTEALNRLVLEMYARGLSTRDIEDTFRDPKTQECLLSRTAVSQLTDDLWEEYETFIERDLSGFNALYLFVDAIYEPLRRAGLREGILCVWAILQDGRKVLIHVVLGATESYAVCLDLFRDLIRRGLPMPLSVTSDGAPGLLRAIEEAFPQSLRIRCWAHKMRNVLEKVPQSAREEVKAHLQTVRDAPTPEAGEQAAADVLERFGEEYPSAMRSFSLDLGASLAHLRLPIAHRKYVRTTNLIERSFVEERRRTKIIPYFTTEKSCLKLVFATLWRASERWQRVRITELEQKQLDVLASDLGLRPGPEGGPGKKTEQYREKSSPAA